jgi:tight adherence protein C
MFLGSIAVLFLVILFATLWFGYRHVIKPGVLLDQVSTSAAVAMRERIHLQEQPAVGIVKVLASLGSLVPSSAKENQLTKRELVSAGLRSEHAVAVYQGIKLLVSAAALVGGIFAREALTGSFAKLALPVCAAIGGYLAPSFLVGRLVQRRRERIRMALPDVLDLMVISTEAGCALDKAILNVSREFRDFHKEISDELSMVNAEMLAGNSRVEALRNLAVRIGDEELNKLVAMLVQTDRFGTSVADALRTQSVFLRTQRRQEAEERAGKVGVKLVFPIFFFFMPGLMVLVLGPGMLELFNNLLPALGSLD